MVARVRSDSQLYITNDNDPHWKLIDSNYQLGTKITIKFDDQGPGRNSRVASPLGSFTARGSSVPVPAMIVDTDAGVAGGLIRDATLGASAR